MNQLSCAKADYLTTALAIPLIVLSVALIIDVLEVVHLIRSKNGDILLRAITLTGAIILTVMFALPMLQTLRFSIHLPFESEAASIEMAGIVEQINPCKYNARYSIKDDDTVYRASIVTVNGEEFFFLSADGLSVGDIAMIKYLPNSKMVLTCQIQEVDAS